MSDWRRDMIRIDRRHMWLVGLLAAAVLIGLLFAWLSRGEFKGRYAVPSLGADGTAGGQSVQTAPLAPPAIVKTAPSVEPTLPRPPRPVTPTPALAAPEDAPDASTDTDDTTRIARAIDKAARKALDRGEPVRWHKAGEKGYVVVSDERDYGGRACRNVSATINSDNGPTQSSSHLWCTTPDGDWAPAE